MAKALHFVQQTQRSVEAVIFREVVESEDVVDLGNAQRRSGGTHQFSQFERGRSGVLQDDDKEPHQSGGVHTWGQIKKGEPTERAGGVSGVGK
jgi:hypothetical protein